MLNSRPRTSTLLVLVDAFSRVYLSNKRTPFLYGLAENGFSGTLEPLFVFRGIETTIFTGVWPRDHNVWTEFKLAQSTRNSGKDRLLQHVVASLQVLPTDELRSKSRYFVERYLFKKFYKTLNLIPSAAMPFFETSQSKETAEKGAVGNITTLFDAFRSMNVSYMLVEPWIRGDRGVLGKAKKLIAHNCRYDFLYVKFSHLDHLGHKFGPEPSMFRDELLRIDNYVEQVVTLLQRKTPELKVLVLADHGMSKVCRAVDILKDLGELRSQLYEDYVVFADSTMLRFWFFSKIAACEIPDFLRQIKFGHILSETEKKSLKIPLDRMYGETIFVLDEGYLVHPSFFHSRSKVKGMHGYAYPKTPEAFPILIMNDEMVKTLPKNSAVRYVDMPYLILNSLFPGMKNITFDFAE